VSRDLFRQRLSNALRKRLYPNTGVTRLHLAHALGKDADTIDNWLNEYSQPDGYLMGELINFFDAGFANEVYGAHGVVVAKISDARKARALQAVNKIAPALDALAEMAMPA
jgi:hypothetical protein